MALLKFNLNGEELSLEEVEYINVDFIIGTHPQTKELCLFVSNLQQFHDRHVFTALHKLGVEVASDKVGRIGNVNYKLLRLNNESTGKREKVSVCGGPSESDLHY